MQSGSRCEALNVPQTLGIRQQTVEKRAVVLEVARSDASAQRRFLVDVREPAVVLDLLLSAQRLDPDLAFRYSCRVAMCGTCALRVDGRPTLACQTRVPRTTAPVRLEPLAGLPVIRDLVVDTAPFWRAWRRAQAWFVERDEGEPVVLAASDSSRRTVGDGLDCIACGACWSACDLTRSDEDGFVGPAALMRAMVLVADRRDGRGTARLRGLSSTDGVNGCHYIGACSRCCPKGLDPSRAIRALRRRSLGVGR